MLCISFRLPFVDYSYSGVNVMVPIFIHPKILKLWKIKCIRGHWHGVVPLLGGEPCVSHDQLKADNMLEHKVGSSLWNKEFRLKYKHSRRDEMKKVLKDERQKARKEDGRNKVFNERLGVHIFSDQEGKRRSQRAHIAWQSTRAVRHNARFNGKWFSIDKNFLS